MPVPMRPLVSPLEFPHPAWRYVLLFQSWMQVQSWAILILGAALVTTSVLKLVEAGTMPPEVVVGVVFGSLFSVLMVLPAQFTLATEACHLLEALESELGKLGYVRLAEEAGNLVYRQDLPRLLRWDEGNVAMTNSDLGAAVKGPVFIVWKLRRALLDNPAM